MKSLNIQRLINLCCIIASFLFLLVSATSASTNTYDNSSASESSSLKELNMQPNSIFEEIKNQNNANSNGK